MTTSEQLDNPNSNFTVPVTRAAGMRIPEFAIRQLIGWALGKTRDSVGTPDDLVDKLFAFVDDGVRNQFKQWLINNSNIYTDVSWPIDPVGLAMIVVEPQSDSEDTDNALLNDRLGNTTYGQVGDQVPLEAPAYGIPEVRTTNVYIASNDSRLTLFLYTLVKFIVVYNKAALDKYYDVHNLVVSGGVLSNDADKLPQFVYYRVLQMRYMTIFDYDGPASGPLVVNLELNVAEFVAGVEVDTRVEPTG
jgi:hypothetical protein